MTNLRKSLLRGELEEVYNELLRIAERIAKRPEGRMLLRDIGIEAGPDAATEVTHDFLADPRFPDRINTLLGTTEDDDTLKAKLHIAVKNYLKDLSRREDRGYLANRIKRLMSESVDIEATDANLWKLQELPQAAPGDIKAAKDAVNRFEFGRKDWISEQRRSPMIADDDLEAMIVGAMSAAGGPLSFSDIFELVAHRLNIGDVPITIDDPTSRLERVGVSDPAPIDLAELSDLLTQQQRETLAALALTSQEAAEQLGVAPSTAHTRKHKLIEYLRSLNLDEDQVRALYESVRTPE